MSEQVKPSVTAALAMQILAELAQRTPLRFLSGLCEQQKQISTAKLAEYVEQAGDQLADYAFKLRQHNDALHAEAEALRAENGRTSEELDKTELRALKFIHQCNAHVDLYRELKAGRDQLSTELEAARGLLEQRIPCDVMLPPATTIKRGCPLSTVLASMKLREDVAPNQRAFTATPAPEVRPDLIRFDFINADDQQDSKMITHDDMRERYADLAEQGERQEAVAFRCKLSIHKDWKYIDHRAPDSFELRECEIQPLYTTPQPGPDVRGLVESIQAAVNAVIVPVTMTPAKAEYYKAGARHIIAKVNEALAAHRQAQRKGESHDT